MLMSFGMRTLYETVVAARPRGTHACVSGAGGLTCAVDTRNAPAMRLYHRLGFERFATRIPLVRALSSAAHGSA
jgi:ribosomal protein S18 acetylase RimI-like enzyme